MRIGDAERESFVEALTEHYVRGRLPLDELDRRQQLAWDAVVQSDLDGLLADLPGDAVRARPTASPPRGVDFWPPDNTDCAIKAAKIFGAPAVLITGAGLAASYGIPHSDLSQFSWSLATGVLGYLTHWVVSRHQR